MNTFRPKIGTPASGQPKQEKAYSRLAPVGFSAQFEDFTEKGGELDALLIKNRFSTFRMRAAGNSMKGAGIHDGDLLIVDRSLTAVSGNIVVAALDGEFAIRRYVVRGKRHFLQPENPDYRPLELSGQEDASIWGVVTYAIHKLSGKIVGTR